MKVKVKFKDYDLEEYSKGIKLSDMPLTEKEIDVTNSQSLTISSSILQIVDEHGNTDKLFQFWESIKITK